MMHYTTILAHLVTLITTYDVQTWMLVIVGVGMLMLLGCMMPGNAGSHGQNPGDQPYGFCTHKKPPRWNTAWESKYPFRTWIQDVTLWASGATDLDEGAIGPNIVLQLSGEARNVAREIDADVLINGRWDNGRAIAGWQILLNTLTARFGQLQQETVISSLSDFFGFTRHQGESIDEVLSRFDIARYKAEQQGGLRLNEVGLSWMVLKTLNIPVGAWPTLLAQHLGNLPNNAAQFQEFLAYVRRNGHLHERKGINQQYFGTDTSWDDSEEYGGYNWGVYASAPIGSNADNYTSDDASSCWSDDHEEVSFDDVQQMDANTAAEHIYLQYRHAKRRWRRFGGPPRRFRKGFGKGYRTGKGKGKSKKGHFWNATSNEHMYNEGGCGGMYHGNAYPTNPLGQDGQPLKCSTCGSTEHLRAKCTKGKGKGKSKTFYGNEGDEVNKGNQDSSQAPASQQAPTTQAPQAPYPFYYSGEGGPRAVYGPYTSELQPRTEDYEKPVVYRVLGTSGARIPPAPAYPAPSSFGASGATSSSSPSNPSMFTFVVGLLGEVNNMTTMVYHTMVKLAGEREGVLVDTGALDNLMGENWMDRVAGIAKRFGQGVKQRVLGKAYGVEGVGGSSQCKAVAEVPICLPDGSVAEFIGPVIPSSQIPALWGLRSLDNHRCIIDCHNNLLWMVGEGGYELKASPGTRMYKLERAMSGHLMFPVTEWNKAKATPTSSKKVL